MAKKKKVEKRIKPRIVQVKLPEVGAVLIKAALPPKIKVVPVVRKKQTWWDVLIFGRN